MLLLCTSCSQSLQFFSFLSAFLMLYFSYSASISLSVSVCLSFKHSLYLSVSLSSSPTFNFQPSFGNQTMCPDFLPCWNNSHNLNQFSATPGSSTVGHNWRDNPIVVDEVTKRVELLTFWKTEWVFDEKLKMTIFVTIERFDPIWCYLRLLTSSHLGFSNDKKLWWGWNRFISWTIQNLKILSQFIDLKSLP